MAKKPLFVLNPSETIADLKDVYFPPYITLAHLYHASVDFQIKQRVLKQYQIQMAIQGTAEYRIENQVYFTRPGDLILQRPNERHSVLPQHAEPYVCISIVFHFGSTSFPIDEIVSSSNYIGNFLGTALEKKLMQLITQYRQPGVVHQIHSQLLLLDILLDLHRWSREQSSQKAAITRKTNHSKMVLVKNYLAEHYNKNIFIHDLENLSGLSQDHLIRQFNKTFGMTPIQYLIRLRVEKAKEYALQSNLSIGEIAGKVGYSDVHTFGKMFKKKTGISLSQFCSAVFTDESNVESSSD